MPQGWAPYYTGRGRQRSPPPLLMAGPSWPLFSQFPPPSVLQPSHTGWEWTSSAMSPDNGVWSSNMDHNMWLCCPVQLLSLIGNQLLSWGTLVIPADWDGLSSDLITLMEMRLLWMYLGKQITLVILDLAAIKVLIMARAHLGTWVWCYIPRVIQQQIYPGCQAHLLPPKCRCPAIGQSWW